MGKSPVKASAGTESSSPKHPEKTTPPRQDASLLSQPEPGTKLDMDTNTDPSKPLAPPPRPGQQAPNTPDFFSSNIAGGGSLNLEPNPFEQSFSEAPAETTGGTKLPSLAALASPSSLIPGSGVTPFANWPGGSLRTGPLSPAMLSGPQADYFTDTHHIPRGFPTPNESSLRTGLTPGGSGSLFPAPSPGSSALFNQLASGGATPSTLDFHRTAISAAAKREQKPTQNAPTSSVTSQPQELTNGIAVAKKEIPKASSGPFDTHDNDAANGLFMLARNGQPPARYTIAPQQQIHATHTTTTTKTAAPHALNASPEMEPHINGDSVGMRRTSDARSGVSEESEPARRATKSRGKRNSGPSATTGRRKAEESAPKQPPNKKSRTGGAAAAAAAVAAAAAAAAEAAGSDEFDMSDDSNTKDGSTPKKPQTDAEKRASFLERNRVAALKCRQRKKQWLASLQQKVEFYSSENETLNSQILALRDEVVNLKTLLLAHKDCPVTQQQGQINIMPMPNVGMVEQFVAQNGPYQLAGQQALNGQAFSTRRMA